KFIELRSAGWSFAKIAEELAIDRRTLIRWASDYRLELAEARKLQKDCLRERLGLTEEKRLERLVSILERLEKRLGDETFESLPPEKALRLYFEVSSKIETAFGENQCAPLSPMERLTAENF
ncbi:MAG: hypothetical protein Q4E67_03430, partial [Planctomycetia bacterium]|nr:hypothetical protein [Planctomycetia bacterium]